jgi:3-oxoacyl-ACP reductase-like protein
MTKSKPAPEAAPEIAPAAAAPAAEPAAAATAEAAPAAAAEPAAATSRSTDIVAGQGGVMTDEAGVITGEVTLRTELSGDQVTLHAQYKDAAEWYVVTGGNTTLKDPADLDAVHAIAVGLLNRPEG